RAGVILQTHTPAEYARTASQSVARLPRLRSNRRQRNAISTSATVSTATAAPINATFASRSTAIVDSIADQIPATSRPVWYDALDRHGSSRRRYEFATSRDQFRYKAVEQVLRCWYAVHTRSSIERSILCAL